MRGSASRLYLQRGLDGLHGIDGGNDGEGYDREPRSLPALSNVTLVHSAPYGPRRREAFGVRLRTGSGLTARDLLATLFGAGAIDATMPTVLLFEDGESSVESALVYLNGLGREQLHGGRDAGVEFLDRDPKLRDVRWSAKPDPRPKPDSPALADDGESYIGAFGESENWLEERTVFGPGSEYDLREWDQEGN